MHKRNLLAFLFIYLTGLTAFAQLTGNEWIVSGQTYYRFNIAKNGMYKIDRTALLAAGLPLASIDPATIQIFNNGVEQPLYIHGEADGSFDANDYIEFYAKRNDGYLDRELYRNTTEHLNPDISLITDTAVYFLTWTSAPAKGKRFTTYSKNNFASFTAETFFNDTSRINSLTKYYYGLPLIPAFDYHSSEYLPGEGWGSYRVGKAADISELIIPLASQNPVIGSGAVLELMVSGLSNYDNADPDHHLQILVSADNAAYTAIKDTIYEGHVTFKLTLNIAQAYLGNITYVKIKTIDDLGAGVDGNVIAYARLLYQRTTDMNGSAFYEFNMKGSGLASDVFADLSNVGTANPFLYDFTSFNRIRGDVNGAGKGRFLFKNISGGSRLVLFDSSQTTAITELKPADMPEPDPSQNYEYLMVAHPTLMLKATEYAAYRQQQYKVLLLTTDQVENYYTYGLHHPLSIRRWAAHFYNNAVEKPAYLLLIGRGLQGEYVRASQYNWLNLVPQLGVPSSDVMYTAGLGNTQFEPAIATGRLPAITNQDIDNYLQKVKSIESDLTNLAMWKKEILQLGGGEGQGQQYDIAENLKSIGQVASGPYMGARVTSLFKATTDQVATNLKPTILQKLNSGIGMLTFYGHGSLNILDIDIGQFKDLSNKDKYPFMYFNGCNVGNISSDISGGTAGVGISGSQYVNGKDAGCRAWLAHSNNSIPYYLSSQTRAFYNAASGNLYGAGLGKIVKETIKNSQVITDQLSKAHSHQFIYLGDPALQLNSPQQPDYSIAPQDLYLSPANVSATSDSFAVSIIVRNMGKADTAALAVSVTRHLPNNAVVTYPIQILKPVFNTDTLYFYIVSKDAATAGFNTFDVELDPDNTISEMNEGNNTASFTFFIPGNSLTLLRPLRYGIVNDYQVKLLAQTQNIFTSGEKVIFEIDTTPLFNSVGPYHLASGVINSTGLLAQWDVNLPQADSMVYYWRVRLNVPVTEGGNWNESSFIVIKGSPEGWSQSHVYQYKGITTADILLDTLQRLFRFKEAFEEITVSAARWRHGGTGIKLTSTQPLTPQAGSCMPSGLIAMVFDKRSLNFDLESQYPYNCANVLLYNSVPQTYPKRLNYYTFPSTPQGQNSFVNFIDSLKNDVYVAVFGFYNIAPRSWPESMYQAFEKIGAGKVRQLTNDSMTYVIVGSKTYATGEATDSTLYNPYFAGGPTPNQNDTLLIAIRKPLQYDWYQGYVISEYIGPAVSWKKVYYSFGQKETPKSDSITFDVMVRLPNGNDSVYFANASPDSVDISSIDPKQFPFIRLRAHLHDLVNRTPAWINRWQVIYQPPPEGLVNPQISYNFHDPVIQEGDSIKLQFAFQNITSGTFDTLSVQYTIADANRITRLQVKDRIKPLAAYDTLYLQKSFSTNGFSNLNTLSVMVNPQGEQPEQLLINNVITLPVLVKPDKSNPLLDVFFDGYRIMNGDIVSPKPVITIVSKDENKYMKLNDTSGFELYLKRPAASTYELIPLSSPEVMFTPATGNNNEARIVYKPHRLNDGIYKLKVLSRDKSGNTPGKPYEIGFDVINESSITSFLPYPNPFTTSMRFVFTLTGAGLPDNIRVRIMTVTGKVVREVSPAEFGPVRIGNNVSEFVWNGTDQYGDRLANGVYLYQVMAKMNGQELKHRQSEVDKYFVQRTGKIYLMR